MKIAFLGVGRHGGASLAGLLQEDDLDVALIVTSPPLKAQDRSVTKLAEEYGIPVIEAANLADDRVVAALEAVRAEIIVSTNWRSRIPEKIFRLPPLAALNVHDALLPEYAGLSAEQWVILNGERETGVTVHVVTAEMDEGPIVCQQAFSIEEGMTSAQVVEQQLNIYPRIIVRAVHLLGTGYVPKVVPAERYRRYHALTREDARLDFRSTPDAIKRQLLAWEGSFGGCWLDVDGHRYGVADVRRPSVALLGVPGRVLTVDHNGAHIVTGRCSKTGGAGIIVHSLFDEAGNILPAATKLRRNLQLQ